MTWTPQRLSVSRGTLSTEAERVAYWRGWLDRVQRPTERALARAWAPMLRAAARRNADRVGEVLGRAVLRSGPLAICRAATEGEIEDITALDAEIAAMTAEFNPAIVSRAVRLAFLRAVRQLGRRIEFDPLTDPATQIIGDMIANVGAATKSRVADVVRVGLARGDTVHDIQRALVSDPGFTPARALRIARTETARTISEGTLSGYSAAADAGVKFQLEWITARDGAVRESHQSMDKQQTDVGGSFVIEGGDDVGASATGPGLFGIARQDINCRCTTNPVNIQG